MSSQSLPKILLFDIGGVCVLSPFKVILEYEIKHGIPPGYINYTIRERAPHGAWQKLERGEIDCDKNFFREFKAELEQPNMWEKYHRKTNSKSLSSTQPVPPIPDIDAEELFWTMMSRARLPDPYMYPALQKLKASGKYKLAALSNTYPIPEGNPLGEPREDDPRPLFEVFVSSSQVGMRKPSRDIYDYTVEKLREKFGEDIKPSDIVFLDDIGENLKTAKSVGMRTIRVHLGKTDEAVKELEKVTGLKLLGEPYRARL